MRSLILTLLLNFVFQLPIYAQSINTYDLHGKDLLKTINRFGLGYPSSSFQSFNGNTVYVWESNRTISVPMATFTYGNFYPGILGTQYNGTSYGGGNLTIQRWCRLAIEVDTNNKIVNWELKGNDCQ